MFTLIRIIFKLSLVIILFPFWFIFIRNRKGVTVKDLPESYKFWFKEVNRSYLQLMDVHLKLSVTNDIVFSSMVRLPKNDLLKLKAKHDELIKELKDELVWLDWAIDQNGNKMASETKAFLGKVRSVARDIYEYNLGVNELVENYEKEIKG